MSPGLVLYPCWRPDPVPERAGRADVSGPADSRSEVAHASAVGVILVLLGELGDQRFGGQ